MVLDETDKKLINLMQKDASLTHKQLAAVLNLTVTPVYERIKKLKRNGVITGVHAKIDRFKIGTPLMALCEVSVTDHKKENLDRFEKEVLNLKEVVECYHVSGRHDYMLKIIEKSMEAYRDFLLNKLANIDGVANVNSSFVMKDLKKDNYIKL